RLLEGQVGSGLLDQALAYRDVLSRAALGVLGHAQHGLEMHARQLTGSGPPGLELGGAGQRQRELAAHVLDLGEEAQGLEVVRLLLEDRRDLRFGLEQLAKLDEHAGVLEALVARFNHRSYLGDGKRGKSTAGVGSAGIAAGA